jgi:hypothetical protein
VHDLVETSGGDVDEFDAVVHISGGLSDESESRPGGAGIGIGVGDSWAWYAYCLASPGLGRLLNVAMMLAFLAISARLLKLLRDQESNEVNFT